MICAAVLVLVATAVFGVLAPAISRRTRPELALLVLVGGGTALTAFCLLALGALAATAAGRLPLVAHLGDWSSAVLEQRSPVAPIVAVLAAGVLVVAVLGAVQALAAHGRPLVGAWTAARGSGRALVVLDDEQPLAYALPGWPGRVVTTSGMLRRLDARGRRAMLAHERAHLAERHDLLVFVSAVVGGTNPLLRRLPAAVGTACERRADEVAARHVGDRRVVARAITLAVRPALANQLVLPAGGDVALRVDALLRERRHSRLVELIQLLLPALVVLAAAAALLAVAQDLDRLLDAASLLRR